MFVNGPGKTGKRTLQNGTKVTERAKKHNGTGKETQRNGQRNTTEQAKKHNGTERNGTGEETLRNGTAGSFSARSAPIQSSFNSRSHPVFIERASRSTNRMGELF